MGDRVTPCLSLLGSTLKLQVLNWIPSQLKNMKIKVSSSLSSTVESLFRKKFYKYTIMSSNTA